MDFYFDHFFVFDFSARDVRFGNYDFPKYYKQNTNSKVYDYRFSISEVKTIIFVIYCFSMKILSSICLSS